MLTESSQSRTTPTSEKVSAGFERLSIALWVAAAVICLVLSVRIVLAAKLSSQDSWFAMSRALEFLRNFEPRLLYDTLLFAQHIKFQYPPTGLLPLEVLNWMGIEGAANYNLLNAVAFLASGLVFAVFAVKLVGQVRCFGLRMPIGPIAFVVAIKYFPDRLAFELGQIQVLLGLLFVLACLALWYGKRALAGLCIAAIAIVKPQFVVFGALALWQRDWRFVGAFAAVTAGTMLVAIGLYGWDVQVSYLKVLQFLSHHGECYHANQSINGILNRVLSEIPCVDADPNADPSSPVHSSWFPAYIPAVYFATLVSSLIMIAIPFVVRAKGTDRMSGLLEFCLAATLFTMASPIAWVHHYNVLLPAYLVGFKVALSYWQGRRMWIVLALLGISLALTGLPIASPYGPTIPALNLVQSHVFFGVCILVGVLLAEIWASRGRSPINETSGSAADSSGSMRAVGLQ